MKRTLKRKELVFVPTYRKESLEEAYFNNRSWVNKVPTDMVLDKARKIFNTSIWDIERNCLDPEKQDPDFQDTYQEMLKKHQKDMFLASRYGLRVIVAEQQVEKGDFYQAILRRIANMVYWGRFYFLDPGMTAEDISCFSGLTGELALIDRIDTPAHTMYSFEYTGGGGKYLGSIFFDLVTRRCGINWVGSVPTCAKISAVALICELIKRRRYKSKAFVSLQKSTGKNEGIKKPSLQKFVRIHIGEKKIYNSLFPYWRRTLDNISSHAEIVVAVEKLIETYNRDLTIDETGKTILKKMIGLWGEPVIQYIPLKKATGRYRTILARNGTISEFRYSSPTIIQDIRNLLQTDGLAQITLKGAWIPITVREGKNGDPKCPHLRRLAAKLINQVLVRQPKTMVVAIQDEEAWVVNEKLKREQAVTEQELKMLQIYLVTHYVDLTQVPYLKNVQIKRPDGIHWVDGTFLPGHSFKGGISNQYRLTVAKK